MVRQILVTNQEIKNNHQQKILTFSPRYILNESLKLSLKGVNEYMIDKRWEGKEGHCHETGLTMNLMFWWHGGQHCHPTARDLNPLSPHFLCGIYMLFTWVLSISFGQVNW